MKIIKRDYSNKHKIVTEIFQKKKKTKKESTKDKNMHKNIPAKDK